MQYPINYDFGKNWNTIIPYLDHPEIKKAIRDGVNDYLSNWDNGERYRINTPPAKYSSKDGYCMLMDRKRDLKFDELRSNKLLPESYLDKEKKLNDRNSDSDRGYTTLWKMKDKILKEYFTWDKIKYDLESYYLSGSCHSYAPTFELTLAKLVLPNEEWSIQSSDKHTTVINKDKTKVFDLLYYCNDDRLENYLFGDTLKVDDDFTEGEQIKVDDPTLGGKDAYIDSL